jgi:hypothetical protein
MLSMPQTYRLAADAPDGDQSGRLFLHQYARRVCSSLAPKCIFALPAGAH